MGESRRLFVVNTGAVNKKLINEALRLVVAGILVLVLRAKVHYSGAHFKSPLLRIN